MGLYDELLEPSSTLTPGQVQTKTVITEKIEIQEDTLTGISQDYLDTGTTEVPSSKALYEAFFRLQDNIEKVDPLKKLLIDTTVITLPLLPTSFDYNDTSWDYNHWYIDREKIVYNGIYEDNYIKINPTDFTYPGTYFLCIKISSIDSGCLQVLNGTNDILATYTNNGSQYLQVDFINTDAQSLIIKAVDTRKDNKIKIDSIGIYRVTERLQDYLDYFVTHHNSAGVSRDEVNSIIDNKELAIYNYLRTNLETMGAEISDHTTNLNNPHVVTCAQIGAAKAQHYHIPSECGAAPEIHTHDPADIGAAYAIHEHTQYVTHTKLDEVVATLDSTAIDLKLEDHKKDTGNPHGVTYHQIGAAPEVHEHEQYLTFDTVDNLIKAEVSQVIIESNDSLVKHVTDTENPHKTTYIQVGAAPEVHNHTPYECGAAPEIHEHSQYVTRDEISNLTSSNNSSGTSVRPMSVISFTTGQVPTGISNNFITKPITPVLLPYILHRTNSNYDYYDGICRTNRPTIEGYPLYYAFKKNLSYEDLQINTCAFSCSVAAPVLLEYEFHTSRKISGYIITPNTSNDEINGYISAYTLYINGKLSHKSNILSFGVHRYTFDEPMNVSVFSLRATKITANNSSYFGCKIEFIFNDVDTTQIKLKSGLKYLNGSTIEEIKDGLITINTVTSIDTPKYLYSRHNNDPDVDSDYELVIDKNPYEFNYYKEGLPVLLGKYEYSNINTSWGFITSSDTSTSNNINTVYKDNNDSYICASDTTIVHEFTDPQILSNLKLVFFNTLLEQGYIPDIINITVHTKSLVFNDELQVEEEIESDTVIYSTDSYIPYLPEDTDDGIWLSPNFKPISDVTSITITLGSSIGSKVGISKIIPYISTNFFNILTNEVTDTESMPFLLGRLDYVSAVDGSFEGCSYSGISIGTNVIIPIDGLDKQESGMHVYRVPNPFHTNYVECTVMIYNNGSYTHTEAIESMSITSETIEIVVFAPARYCLNIKRIW